MSHSHKETRPVCEECGSAHVAWDAFAEWDAAQQCDVLRASYDAAHCFVCEGETSLVWEEVRRATDLQPGDVIDLADSDTGTPTWREVLAVERPNYWSVLITYCLPDGGWEVLTAAPGERFAIDCGEA